MQDNLKIFLIEDDYALAAGTEYALQSEGMTVCHAQDFAQTKKLFLEHSGDFDLILLDIMLPDADGYQVFEWIRKMNAAIPVIFLTALDDEGNVVYGLSIGASDYVTKPFRIKELTARIRANVRKHKQEMLTQFQNQEFQSLRHESSKNFQASQLENSEFQLDEEHYRLKKAGENIELTPSEFRLLRHLMQHPHQVLTRGQLIENLWSVDEAFIDDNTLSVYIRRIREKIDEKEGESHIKTIRGRGYTWQGGT